LKKSYIIDPSFLHHLSETQQLITELMEPPSAEVPGVASSRQQVFLNYQFAPTGETFRSMLAMQSRQMGGDSLGVASAAAAQGSPHVVLRVRRSQTSAARASRNADTPPPPLVASVARQPSAHLSLSQNNRPYRPMSHARTVAAAMASTLSIDDSPSGPNTRSSRKRRSSEVPVTEILSSPDSSSPAPAGTTLPPPQRKRRRAKVATNLKKPPPGPKVDVEEEKQSSPDGITSCCICMCDPDPEDQALINGCDHQFCFECIEKWSERENSCPLCKIRFTKIDRVQKQRRKKGIKSIKNTKKIKQRDQRSDLVPGAALEGLLGKETWECRVVEGRLPQFNMVLVRSHVCLLVLF
jgi:hypothetical protein